MAKKWTKITAGQYGGDVVKFDQIWFVKYDDRESSVIDRPLLMCIQYYHQDFTKEGIIEQRILVDQEGFAIYN